MIEYFLQADVSAHKGALRCLDATQSHLVTGGLDGVLRVWSRRNPQKIVEVQDHKCPVYAIKISEENTIFSGSQKGALFETDLSTGRCVRAFVGHTNTVCSLAASSSHLISGSWDATARVWNRSSGVCEKALSQCHAHAVSVCSLGDGRILTGSQSKSLNLFDTQRGVCVVSYENAHEDIIRHIAKVEGSDLVLTCSNAGDVRAWSVQASEIIPLTIETWPPSDTLLFDVRGWMVGPTSMLIVTGSDDGTCKVALLECEATRLVVKETISLWPHTSSVWAVALIPSESSFPDIVTGCGDGHLRIFTSTRSAGLPEIEILKKREEAMNTIRAAKAKQSAGSTVDMSKLTNAKDRHSVRGRMAGQTKLFVSEDGSMVEVYQWSGSEWTKVGDMVHPEDEMVASNQVYEGDDFFAAGRYDFVWDVQIETKPGQNPRLPFRLTDNPMEVAERFCAREQISKINVPDILNFIKTNSGQGPSGSVPSGRPPASPTPQEVPGGPTSPSSVSMSGQLGSLLPVTFPAGANWDKALEKIRELSALQPPELQLDMRDLICLDSLTECFKKPVFDRAEIKQGDLHFLFGPESKWRQWKPETSLFPLFDMWRKVASHSASADYFRRSGRGQDQVSFAFDTLESIGLLTGGATSLCLCRYLVNVCQWSGTKGWFFDHVNYMISKIRNLMVDIDISTPIKKNTVNAIFAFLLNLSIAAQAMVRSLGASSQAQREEMQVKIDSLAELVADLIEKVDDPICISTGVYAIGVLRLSSVPHTSVGASSISASKRAVHRAQSLGLDQSDKLVMEAVQHCLSK